MEFQIIKIDMKRQREPYNVKIGKKRQNCHGTSKRDVLRLRRETWGRKEHQLMVHDRWGHYGVIGKMFGRGLTTDSWGYYELKKIQLIYI